MYVDMGAASATMQNLGFDPDVITQVMNALEVSADTLQPATQLESPAADQFGVTNENARLGYHSERARDRVAEAVMDMVNGLLHYSVALRELRDRGTAADETTVASVQATEARLAAGANCINTDAIKDQNVCVAPSSALAGGEG